MVKSNLRLYPPPKSAWCSNEIVSRHHGFGNSHFKASTFKTGFTSVLQSSPGSPESDTKVGAYVLLLLLRMRNFCFPK